MVQLGFIASRSVLLDEPDLGRAVNDGEGLGQERIGARMIFGDKKPAHGPNLMTQACPIAPIKQSASFLLADPLQRGIMISHC